MIKTNSEYLLREFIRNINFYKNALAEGSQAAPTAAEVNSDEASAALKFVKQFFTPAILNDMEYIVDGWEGFIDAITSISLAGEWSETINRVLSGAIEHDKDPSISTSTCPNLTLYMTCIGLLSADNHNIPVVLGDAVRLAQGAPTMSELPIREGKLDSLIDFFRGYSGKGLLSFTEEDILPTILKSIRTAPLSLEVLKVAPLKFSDNGQLIIISGNKIKFADSLKQTLEGTHIITDLDDSISTAMEYFMPNDPPTVSSLKKLLETIQNSDDVEDNTITKISEAIESASDEITGIVDKIDLDAVTAAINRNATTLTTAVASKKASKLGYIERGLAAVGRNKLNIAAGITLGAYTLYEMSPVGFTSVKDWYDEASIKGEGALQDIIDLLSQYYDDNTLAALVAFLKENQNQK